tara:strand:+ start:767 stop:880 length:114 start_codon:yes stop_codon:yes gene_type:complete
MKDCIKDILNLRIMKILQNYLAEISGKRSLRIMITGE